MELCQVDHGRALSLSQREELEEELILALL